jgi:hypothetical protein
MVDIENKQQVNLAVLHQEITWLEQVIQQVITSYLKHEGHENHWTDIPLPDLTNSQSNYAKSVQHWSLNTYDRLAIALTLVPHLRPEVLDVFFGLNQIYDRPFTEFGGVTDKTFSGFIPTGQTLNFLICGNDPLWREYINSIVAPEHILNAEQVIQLHQVEQSLPVLSGVLSLSEQWLHYFITGEKVRLEMTSAFPAHPISTPLQWTELVLENNIREQIEEIKTWLTHGDKLMSQWGLHKKLKPGYRALLYGPPGTGKTLTACLLAKSTGREIYRVDLSMIVSKYIGETEKNIGKVFDIASYKDWILFFDEADALFGKRTETSNSNDRHANQQTGYLLQRIEDFPGVVILATNLKTNMDDAFTRRFQAMIHITMPAAEQRLQLWKNAFSDDFPLAQDVDLNLIAEKYELAGGAIINVLRYCALQVVKREQPMIYQEDIIEGLRREFKKDNKTLSRY